MSFPAPACNISVQFEPRMRTFSAIPEPPTWAMLLIGFAGIGFAGYSEASAAAFPSALGPQSSARERPARSSPCHEVLAFVARQGPLGSRRAGPAKLAPSVDTGFLQHGRCC
jgi:hypothetical protein